MYEVHYCNPIEYGIFKIQTDKNKIEKENDTFTTFSEAKKDLLKKLRRDKQIFADAIDKVSIMKKVDCY